MNKTKDKAEHTEAIVDQIALKPDKVKIISFLLGGKSFSREQRYLNDIIGLGSDSLLYKWEYTEKKWRVFN